MMRCMTTRIRAGDVHVLDVQTRMPFKYGIAPMTRAPHACVRLHVEVDGARHTGIAADLLPPKWFTKNPDRALDDEVAEMARVIAHAVNIAIGVEGESAFGVWRQIWDAQSYWGMGEELP